MTDSKRARVQCLTLAALVGVLASASAGDAQTSISFAGSCGAVRLSEVLRVAPAAEGQAYRRCRTYGDERSWRVQLSADHSRIAALTDTGTVRLIETSGLREVAELASPLGAIEAVAFSPDGTLLAAAAPEMGQVSLWRSTDGTLVSTVTAAANGTIGSYKSQVAFSSDGRLLATPFETIFDLTTGSSTTWDGKPTSHTLPINPQVSGYGTTWANIAFVDDDHGIFSVREGAPGNSAPSQRIQITRRDGAPSHVIYDQYADYLDGLVLSHDRRWFAIAGHAGASLPGLPPNRGGLAVYAMQADQPLAKDEDFFGKLLAISRDQQRIYVVVKEELRALDARTLAPRSRFAWPAGARFLGVAPDDSLVLAQANETTWRDPATGDVRRRLPDALREITWSSNGQFGAGRGTQSLGHLFREPDGSRWCRLSLQRIVLGLPLDSYGKAQTDSGTIAIERERLIHTHGTDWYRDVIREKETGTLLRVFGAHSDLASGPGQAVVISPDGSKAYSKVPSVNGPVSVWCR